MKKEILREQSKIISNKRAGANYFEIVLESPKIADICLPGQFIEIRISSTLDPLLRRPFSIHRIGYRDKNEGRKSFTIAILYEVVGKGTEILSQKKPGEYLDIIGPLGQGFVYREPRNPCLPAGRENRKPILVAGGMGVAPLLFLAEKLDERRRKRDEGREKILVLIGAKTKSHIVCADDFKELGCDVKIATDDGSQGFKGKVTELLKKILVSRFSSLIPRIYACGPRPMLKALTQISKQYNIPAQISLEAHMACGIGACLGCVINTTGGFKRVCKEGPVFNSEEILW